MAELKKSSRPDVDIEADIQDLIAHYPPLQSDRFHLKVMVKDGIVTLAGHTKSRITRGYLIERVQGVAGVQAVNYAALYDEETIRLDVGRCLAQGVIANAAYGTVVLTGSLPKGIEAASVVNEVARVAGVENVVTKFD